MPEDSVEIEGDVDAFLWYVDSGFCADKWQKLFSERLERIDLLLQSYVGRTPDTIQDPTAMELEDQGPNDHPDGFRARLRYIIASQGLEDA